MKTCPTPNKRAFSDRDRADFYGAGMRPYKCRCGRWHLSHMTRDTHKFFTKAHA